MLLTEQGLGVRHVVLPGLDEWFPSILVDRDLGVVQGEVLRCKFNEGVHNPIALIVSQQSARDREGDVASTGLHLRPRSPG